MSYVVVVEQAGQQHIQKVTLSSNQPVLLGRAWQNEVIVNDEFIDASHLQFSMNEEGQILVEDLDTKNGSQLDNRRITVRADYAVGTKIAIGESSIALYDRASTVAPAMKRDVVHTASRIFGSFAWVVAASLAAGAGLLAHYYLGSSTEVTKEFLVNESLQFAILAFAWSLFAGFLGKLFRHKAHVGLHWVFICTAFTISVVTMLLVDLWRFNLDSEISEVLLQNGTVAVLFGLFVYGTLSLSTRFRSAIKIATSVALPLIPLTFSLVTPMLAEEHEKWSYQASVGRINQPPALLLRNSVTLEAHIRNTNALFAQLDAEVKTSESTTRDNAQDSEVDDDTIEMSGLE